MAGAEIPQELRELAGKMGVDVEQVAAAVAQQQGAPQPPAGAQQAAGAGVGGVGVVTPGGAQVAEGVTAAPAETPEERLQRELAVAQQELQQTRQHMQTMEAGRVIGNSGVAGQGAIPPPSLATLEPGLRWAVRNGLMAVESIADPLIRDLFAADKGGIV